MQYEWEGKITKKVLLKFCKVLKWNNLYWVKGVRVSESSGSSNSTQNSNYTCQNCCCRDQRPISGLIFISIWYCNFNFE